MKMIMAIVPRKYGDDVLSALINAGHSNFSETRGGMLRQSQLTLFIAGSSRDVQTALNASQIPQRDRIYPSRLRT